MRPFDVFTPAGVPTVTYIDRGDQNLEQQLRDSLQTPGLIVSLSGPSKSGKTTLVRKVISEENLISVSGGAIRSGDELWDRVLNWMMAPSETTRSTGTKFTGEAAGEASGKIGILIAGAEGKASGKFGAERESSHEEKHGRGGLDQVVREIAGSEYVVFIDDFHYMSTEVQAEVARQIKEAAEKGVHICTASVPHRADDVVRRNPELRGRVKALDFAYWKDKETVEIAHRGFDALNLAFSSATLERMATEAFGSPQLMQQICLQTCLYFKANERATSPRYINPSDDELNAVFEQASTTTDFSSLLEALHTGPKKRGSERNKFEFNDGSHGDVYRCVLICLAQDPPQLSFTYDEMYQRSKAVCRGSSPGGSGLSQALEQCQRIAEDIQPRQPVLEWSEDVLDVADPYFLYYLRCSSRLAQLQEA